MAQRVAVNVLTAAPAETIGGASGGGSGIASLRPGSPEMTRQTDIRTLMVTTAIARTDASRMSPPLDPVGSHARMHKATGGRIEPELAKESMTSGTIKVCEETDGAVDILPAERGRAAAESQDERTPDDIDKAEPLRAETAGSPGQPTKTATIISLLTSDTGATLADIVGATGWLPHTTRAALTGLRKRGYVITGTKEGKITRYHIVVPVAA